MHLCFSELNIHELVSVQLLERLHNITCPCCYDYLSVI